MPLAMTPQGYGMTADNTQPIQTGGVGSSAAILARRPKKKKQPAEDEPHGLPVGHPAVQPSSAAVLTRRKK